jgi:integrase
VQGIEARGAAETAGGVFQRLRSIFRYASAHDVIKTDPTYPLKPAEIFKPRKVNHRGTLSERDVPTFLRRLAAYEGDPTTLAALTLLTLTAPRPGELRRAWWNEIDADCALWRVPSKHLPRRSARCVRGSGADL